jgi:hypothetical protein
MKKLVFLLLAGIILIASCKENDTPLTLSSAASDTTYTVTPVPSADPHNVLVEMFSGQSCSNCPGGETTMASIIGANTSRVNIIDYFVYGIPQANPVAGDSLDLRDSAATTIGAQLYGGPGALPSAGIDRIPSGSQGLVQSQGTWSTSVDNAMGNSDSINLSVKSTYNAASLTANVVVDITYLQSITSSQKLSLVLVEDSIYGTQEFPAQQFGGPYASGYDTNYLYMNVCRDVITSVPSGDAILDTVSTKKPGLVNQIVYNYTLSAAKGWLPQHCRWVAFVTDANGEVMQSETTKLMGN